MKFVLAVRRIYRERRNLAKSLSDLENAIHKLDLIFKSITTVLLLLVTMLVFGTCTWLLLKTLIDLALAYLYLMNGFIL